MSGDHNMYQKPRSYVDDDTQYDEAQVQAMIKKAVLNEREACARWCDLVAREIDDKYAAAVYCAKGIRARSE